MYNFETTYTNLDKNLFEIVNLPNIKNPSLVLYNLELANRLNICKKTKYIEKEILGYYDSKKPFAQAYSGHQFGYYTILGDGRALILGEHVSHKGVKVDIQLKGSGITKYSRGGDGKATTNSMVREYLYSYIMKNLGIPSSESLAVIKTSEPVIRDDVYEGAILVRIMSSHIRFGTFEFASKYLAKKEFIQFVDYVIDRHYNSLSKNPQKYELFFKEVMEKTILMVVDWYRVGFVHGVMNTDNMSIVGETFDYGPCTFLNSYKPKKSYSKIDRYNRYCFENQKDILFWNLNVLAKTLRKIADIEKLQEYMDEFDNKFRDHFQSMMYKKLGITTKKDYSNIVKEFLEFLEKNELDYTNTFIELMYPGTFKDLKYSSTEFKALRTKIGKIGLDIKTMQKYNPQRILRNNILEEALEKYDKNKNVAKINMLLEALKSPYEKDKRFEDYQKPPKEEFDTVYTTHCNT